MFWNSSAVKHSRFYPKYILDSDRDVVSISNITKDQTENLIPCINCLEGVSFFAGESLRKIKSCFKKIDSSFSVDLVEITPTGCVVS